MAFSQTKIFSLATNNYIDIQSTTNASTTHDDGVLIALNDSVGFVMGDIGVSTKFTAVKTAAKVTARKKKETISAGQLVYWDNGAQRVTAVDSSQGLPALGFALEDAASGDEIVIMDFAGGGKGLT